MKLQFVKRLFAFIITIMMFSGISGITNAQQSIVNTKPESDNAQQSCNQCHYHLFGCGPGYICRRGCCVRYIYMNTDPFSTNDVLSISDINPADFSLQLTEAQYVSLKIYDETGRLIKTLADSRLPQGEYQIDWNKTDDYGHTASVGLYIMQLYAGPDYSDTVKLSVMN